MATVYRGTNRPEIKGVRKGLSFTYSLPVAVIYSSVPGDPFARSRELQKAHFLPSSTVHVATVNAHHSLEFPQLPYMTFREALRLLNYGFDGGISGDEAVKILNYLHNRLIEKAKGGPFKYQVLDEDDGEPLTEENLPLSFTSPITLLSEFRDSWAWDGNLDTAELLVADSYIFADAPAFQRSAVAQGYDSLIYPDVFESAEYATEDLIGQPVWDLEGVEEEQDIEGEFIPVHMTLRILDPNIVVETISYPTEEVLPEIGVEAA